MTVALRSVLLLLGLSASIANCWDFLGIKRVSNYFSNTSSDRVVREEAVRKELDGILGEIFGRGHGVVNAHLVKIQSALEPMFHSLPQNRKGHISAPDMRYSVQRYFSQNHGWKLKGFDVHEQWNTSSTSDGNTSQSKLPDYVESILEQRLAHQGFSLPAVVAITASLERLAFDSLVRSVENAFYLNSFDVTKALSDADMTRILTSFFVIEYRGPTLDKQQHKMEKKLLARRYPHWHTTMLFLKDAVSSDIFKRQTSSNPFVDQAYSFEDAVRMAEQISVEWGSWSNHECQEQKDTLMTMDKQGTGRVKLSDFHNSLNDGAWQFSDTTDELRQAGVLDESSAWAEPQVLIPNYIYGRSNCLIQRSLYSICCLNECDRVFQHLEAQIAAPNANGNKIIEALEGLPLSANITTTHRELLDRIAHMQGGKIPIHGRHFAGWLHAVFPQECPYPQAYPDDSGVAEDKEAMDFGWVPRRSPAKQQQWQRFTSTSQESAANGEMAQLLQNGLARLGESLGKTATTQGFLPARSGGTLVV